MKYVALLRGINVGGKNRLPMKDLVRMFEAAGCTDVQTYIQSGNVVFRVSPSRIGKLPALVGKSIQETFGYRIPIVIRTANQLREVSANNPFLRKGAAEECVHVLFLNDYPEAEIVSGLDPARSAPDAFVVRGSEIYLHLPNGAADTKLTNAYFDSRLKTICTGRNWKTTLKLLEMMGE
jgi:uncharacterized protein (DUF1697 family)